MQISATHLSVIWTFWVMVWYMNTLFIYWLYLGSSPSYNDTPPSVFGYFFPPSIWENRVIDLLVENPLFIWKCVTCQLWLGILCIKKKKRKNTSWYSSTTIQLRSSPTIPKADLEHDNVTWYISCWIKFSLTAEFFYFLWSQMSELEVTSCLSWLSFSGIVRKARKTGFVLFLEIYPWQYSATLFLWD